MTCKKDKKHTYESWFYNTNTVLWNILLQDWSLVCIAIFYLRYLITPVLNQFFINKSEWIYWKCAPKWATNAEKTLPCKNSLKNIKNEIKFLFVRSFPNKEVGFSRKDSWPLKYFNVFSFPLKILSLHWR